jgi:hypothetical protein
VVSPLPLPRRPIGVVSSHPCSPRLYISQLSSLITRLPSLVFHHLHTTLSCSATLSIIANPLWDSRDTYSAALSSLVFHHLHTTLSCSAALSIISYPLWDSRDTYSAALSIISYPLWGLT